MNNENNEPKETTVNDLNLDTTNVEEKEESVLDLSSTSVSNSTLKEATVDRGKLELDMDEYVDISKLGAEEKKDIFEENAPTSFETENTIARNDVDIDLVDINKIGTEDEEPVSQEEHDENINSTTKVNEAGKKEIRIEVDETVTRVHEQDNKVKKKFLLGFVAILIILGFFSYKAILNNRYNLFVRKVKAAASNFMEDDSNAATVYALYSEKIDKYVINVNELKRRDFIDFELKNPKTGEDMSGTKVEVTLDGGVLIYTYPAE